MAIFRVQVNYQLGTVGKWSNVWHVDAADLSTAADGFEGGGVPNLLPLLHNGATLVSLLVSDPDTNAFISRPINAAGTSSASDDILPLYNTVKVLFPSPTFGRPDYKFLKGFVTESVQTAGNINSGTIGAITGFMDSLIADMITASAPLVSLNGEAYADVSIQSAVQMRQMHRRRRRATPTP